MTGPEHYREAERLLDKIRSGDLTTLHKHTPEQALSIMSMVISEAQVHATLALAAATAMCGNNRGDMAAADFQAWGEACGCPE